MLYSFIRLFIAAIFLTAGILVSLAVTGRLPVLYATHLGNVGNCSVIGCSTGDGHTPPPPNTTPPTEPPPANPPPANNENLSIGYFDGANCSVLEGWAADPANSSTSIRVHIYDRDKFVAETVASHSRPDVNRVMGFAGNHGFRVELPASFKDGNEHQIYIYPVSSRGDRSNRPLTWSPRPITCRPLVPAPQTVVVTAADKLVAVRGKPTTFSFSVTGGTQPYRWELGEGMLPPGMALQATTFNCITTPCINPNSSYLLTGTPTQNGNFRFRLDVRDARNNFATATFGAEVSDAENQVSVTAPAAGEVVRAGQAYTIRWQGGLSSESVNLDLLGHHPGCVPPSTGPCPAIAIQPERIANNIANTGSFIWQAPERLGIGSWVYQIRAEAGARSGLSGLFKFSGSNNSGGITVTSPQTGTVWEAGTTQTIAWSPSSQSNVDIYSDVKFECDAPPGAACIALAGWRVEIAKNVPNTGRFSWTIPTGDSKYLGSQTITVVTTDGTASGSSGEFRVKNAAGDRIIRTGYVDKVEIVNGEPKIEGWAYQSNAQPTCVIVNYISVSSGSVLSLAPNVPQQFRQEVCPTINRPDAERWLRQNHGSNLSVAQPLGFEVWPGKAITTSGAYRIQYVVLSQSTGTSLELAENARRSFEVKRGSVNSLNITSPTRGSVWKVGGSYRIAWSGVDVARPVRISLEKYFACLYTQPACKIAQPQNYVIAENVAGGVFTWHIPSSLPDMYLGDVRIIVEAGNGNDVVLAHSDVFRIESDQNTSQIYSPAAGDTWKIGETYAIKWQLPEASSINISLDSAICRVVVCPAVAPYQIAQNVANTGELRWQVPKDISSRFVGPVYIRITDTVGSSRSIISSDFVIQRPDLPPPPTGVVDIATRSNLLGFVGKRFSAQFVVVGPNASAYKLRLEPGSVLPPGLELWSKEMACVASATDALDCLSSEYLLQGLPKQAGSFSFGLQVVNGDSVSTTKQFTVNIRPDTAVNLTPGSVLLTAGGAVHVVLDGGRYYTFRSWDEFLEKGYRDYNIRPAPQNALTEFVQVNFFERPVGTVFRYVGDRTVYQITPERCKQAFTSLPLLNSWRILFADILVLPQSEQFPTCSQAAVPPPAGVAVKGNGPTLYLFEGRRLRPLPSMDAYRRIGSPQIIEIGSDVGLYPVGETVN